MATGESRYLVLPSRSQVTRALFGGDSTDLVHLKSWKAFMSSGDGFHFSASLTILAAEVGSFSLYCGPLSLAPGFELAEALDDALALGSAVGRAEGFAGPGVGPFSPTDSSAWTMRNPSWAVWPTISTSLELSTFGAETTMLRSPIVVTDDSPTPSELTRC